MSESEMINLARPEKQLGSVFFDRALYSNGTSAVVLCGKQLFCGTTRISIAFSRVMAEIGGCHPYTGEVAAGHANNGYPDVCVAWDGFTAREVSGRSQNRPQKI